MTKIYIIYISFIAAILISTIALGQVVVFEDNFDIYTSGQQLACQNPTVWTTWTGNPCSLTEDAYISNNYSFSGVNSLVIKQYNDIVRDHGLLTSGICEINFQVFIPTGKAGYFNTLYEFAPPVYGWAMQVYFDSPGTGKLDAAGQNAAAFSYPQNKWIPVKVVADLVIDRGEFWLDGILIHSWQWSKGTFGSSTIPLQLDGTDFYGATVNDEMYVDDYNITHTAYISKISSTITGGNWSSPSTWIGGLVPDSNTPVEIIGTSIVNLDNDIIRDAETLINGRLNCETYNISGTSDFILYANATLEIGASTGISSSGTTGNLQVTGLRLLNPSANYIYNGSESQVTGNGLPSNINNLTINNLSGVTLSLSTSVSGTLNLVNGNLLTDGNTITLGTSVSNLGTLVYTSGKVIGNFRRWFSASAVSNVLFPVGTSPSKYTPVSLNNVVGNGTFTVNAISGIHPNAPGTNVLHMYWKLTNGGITSTDLIFNYLDVDIVGDEAQYELAKFDGNWIFPSPTTINNVANTVSINGINTFSDWTLGEPVALPVELSSFSASVIGSAVKLNWQTATEINNYGFDVERKSNVKGQTSNVWEKIGFVNGNGNSNSPKYYSFSDASVVSGTYAYRLKQIDNDGQSEYSKVVEVSFIKQTDFSLEQNFPNPFNPNTSIRFSLPETGNVKLTVYNLLGQEIATLVNGVKEAGTHTINYNAEELNSGIYIYRIESNGFNEVRKMTLIK